MLENVKNLKTHDNGNTFKIIESILIELGYNIDTKIINTKTYGNIPQNRERIIIVGFKDEKCYQNFHFPEEIKLTSSPKDFLENVVSEKYYYNNKPLYERIKDDIAEEGVFYQWRRKYVRRNMSGVCPTLTANMGSGGHNVPIIKDSKGIRKLTPRECFNLQGFPSSFNLPNISDAKLYKQAGNSVSIPAIQRVAKVIYNSLKTS